MSVVDWFVRSPADAVVDLGPALLDLRAYRSDTFAARFTFRYADGSPVVLNGTWRAQIRADAQADEQLDEFAVDTVQQASGIIAVSLAPAKTAALPQRSVWDLENVAAAGTRTWFAGTLYIGGDVTR